MLEKKKNSYNFLTEHEKDTKCLMKYFSNNKKDKIGNRSGLRLASSQPRSQGPLSYSLERERTLVEGGHVTAKISQNLGGK